MSPRDRIVERMANAIANEFEADYDNSGGDLMYISHRAADAALRALEQPVPTMTSVIKPCTCDHNGYGKHSEGCELA
jgi:hypothetical protein